jgi:hypothetical protein
MSSGGGCTFAFRLVDSFFSWTGAIDFGFDLRDVSTASEADFDLLFELPFAAFPPTAFLRRGRSFSDSLKEENDSSSV